MKPTQRSLRSTKPLLLYVIEGTRSLANGFFTITFVVYAQRLGLGAAAIGLLSGLSVVVGIGLTQLLTRVSDNHGTRPALVLSAVLMTATGVATAASRSPVALGLVAFLGFLPPSGGLFVNAVIEGELAHRPRRDRTKVFARYGLVQTAAAATGALLAGMPSLLGHPGVGGLRAGFVGLSLLGAVVGALALAVAEPPRETLPEAPLTLGLQRSRAAVHKLAALFVADSLGSGMVATTLVVYWLHVHFHFGPAALGALLFGVDIASAASFPMAEVISRRIGLLNTAVFTHIPSSVLLMAVPFAPAGWLAGVLLVTRGLLVEMDVPTRQSYIASIVDPSERKAAAGMTGSGKQAGRALGPLIGGAALQAFGAVVPFVAGGAVKIGYDLALWRSFRGVQERS
ncbi:MAG: MFS transporter [Acidimicrobiales bacterium]